MSVPLISVIVPVYKVEFWLPKCVKSLLKQTYGNLEILLIDDGSPDASGKICDALAQKDKRIKVIHKKNGGVSSARNKGIEESTGQYLFFVDSDDWLHKNAIKAAYDHLVSNNAQLSVLGYEIINLKNTTFDVSDRPLKIDFTQPQKAFSLLEKEENTRGVTGKLFQAEIIKTNDIKFDENIKLAEDGLFLFQYLMHCNAICMTRIKGYCYNRLLEATAITKYYENTPKWMFYLCKARERLAREKTHDQTLIDHYVMAKALIDFEYLLNYCCLHFQNSEEAVELYKKTYNEFSVFFKNVPFEENTTEGYILKNIIHQFCIHGDFEGLYQYIKKNDRTPNDKKQGKIKGFIKKAYRRSKSLAYRYLM